MKTTPLPTAAAWVHCDVRDGFESVFFDHSVNGGVQIAGTCAAVENGVVWAVRYVLSIDHQWRTRSVIVAGRSSVSTARTIHIDSDGEGAWTVDGVSRPDLDGYLDVDIEASVVTNTLPMVRLNLVQGNTVDAPAVYVHAADLNVGHIRQDYTLLSVGDGFRARYRSSTFEFEANLTYDSAGLILDYPGLAKRAQIH
jgi:hypothetical protein